MLSAALAPLISDCLLHQIDEDFLAAYQASYGVAQPETTPTDHTQITAAMETRSESINTALKEAKNSEKKVHVRVYSTVCTVHVHDHVQDLIMYINPGWLPVFHSSPKPFFMYNITSLRVVFSGSLEEDPASHALL